MQDQGSSGWYEANDLLSDPSNHDADGKEFSDWRLPTNRELSLMYVVYNNGNAASLNANDYWSSTEFDNYRAWYQPFGVGNQAVCSQIKMNFFAQNLREVSAN
jgi:hypothetical protein